MCLSVAANAGPSEILGNFKPTEPTYWGTYGRLADPAAPAWTWRESMITGIEQKSVIGSLGAFTGISIAERMDDMMRTLGTETATPNATVKSITQSITETIGTYSTHTSGYTGILGVLADTGSSGATNYGVKASLGAFTASTSIKSMIESKTPPSGTGTPSTLVDAIGSINKNEKTLYDAVMSIYTLLSTKVGKRLKGQRQEGQDLYTWISERIN